MTTEPEGAAAAGDYPHPVRAAVLRVVGEPMVVETIRLKTVGPDDVRVRIDRRCCVGDEGECPLISEALFRWQGRVR